ncbi:MAG TPA: hypothetical protein PLU17_08425 [Chitinophagaceae bacterium]|nr:hypothetical protein [Chitinophagaceae bacterium]
MRKIQVSTDSLKIDSLSIIPHSFFITDIDTSDYTIDDAKALLRWKKRPLTDSIFIIYRVFPQNFTKRYFHKDAKQIEQSFVITPFYYDAIQANSGGAFIDFGNVDYNGSFGRALSFGNSQDVVLNSQFNLQLEGDLGDSIKLSGAITDNTVPFQPEGNTQQLQEFDRVSIQLQRKRATLIVGDYDIKRPSGYFMNFYKRVQGGFFSTSFKTSAKGENKISLGASLAKGKFVRNVLTPLEGNQGPYKLYGPNGEQFFIILAGTERIYIDGIQMKRGEDYDYIIDYNTAEVTFMPKRFITKDLRITAEFEFSDRNYLNSLVYLNNEWNVNPKLNIRLNVYSNQDAKNQTVQQSLDSSKIRFLSTIGDSIQNAFYTSVQFQDTFSNSKVLYKKIDTIINSVLYNDIYIFSTNKDSAKYSLSFSFVGPGRGNYIQSINSTNGRVYAWQPPLGGVLQGDYEPIVVLVTPKKQQMITLGTTYKIDSLKRFNIETAYSNSDPNTFSTLDNNTHHGIATLLNYDETRLLNKSKDITLSSRVSYEFVQKQFRALERFRNVEFSRDWNITANEKLENEHLGFLSFSLNKLKFGKIDYQFGTYHRGNSFNGTQHIASVSGARKGYRFLLKGDYMQQSSLLIKSKFYRPYLEFEKQFEKLNSLTMGTRYLVEHNELRNALTDSLEKAAFSFDALTFYIKNKSDAKNNFVAEYTHRNDRATKENAFKQSTEGHTFSLSTAISSIENHDLRFTGAYRILDIKDSAITALKPDENSLGRIEYNFSTLKGLVAGNILYEFGSGQEQKREFAYFEVPAGQGLYVWRDYNKDSLKQLNEFELAIFPDEKLYIKIFTPTNQYVKAKYSIYNQSISINPKAILKATKLKGIKKFVSLFFIQSAVQLNNRFVGQKGIEQYNPFISNFDDSVLINNSSSVINSVFFNRFSNSWGIDLVQTLAGGKTLLNYGIDSRKNLDYLLRGRYNVTKQITLSCGVKTGNKDFVSQFLENRNYKISYQSVEPAITVLLKKNQFRIQLGYKYDLRQNLAHYGGEKAKADHVNLELKYNILSSGAISTRTTFTSISYNGSENSGVGYTMLDGLQKGKNWLWQASFNKRVSKNIEMNFEYEGRKPSTSAVIHTGRASVRAIF